MVEFIDDTPEELADTSAAEFEDLLPETVEAIDEDTHLAALEEETAFDDPNVLPDLIVEQQVQQPLGKSWAFDFASNQFYYSGQRGPTPTYGLTTLRYWIEKCLMTPRGSSSIHDDNYGIDGLHDLIGEPHGVVVAALRNLIPDALTFHPRISEVADIEALIDPNSETLEVSFRVVTDEDDELTVRGFTLVRGD